ncbi:MAG: hypothetical protein ACJ77K_15705 [Bacteroidia bacterium]|jgi:hypothetical protein
MKKIILGCSLVLALNNILAQPVLKEWESFNKDNKKDQFDGFLGADETGFYLAVGNKAEKKNYLEKRDKQNGALIYRKDMNAEAAFSFVSGKNIVVLYNTFDKPTDTRTLTASVFLCSNGEKVKDFELCKMKAQLEMGNHTFDYGFSLSPDHSKFLVVPHHTWYIHEVNDLQLFDAGKMSLIWKKDFDQKQIITDRYEVDNDGDVVFAEDQSIGMIPNKSKEATKTKLQFPDDVYPKEIALKFSSGDVIAACVYKRSNDNGISGGVAFFRVGLSDLKIKQKSIVDFDKLASEKLTWEDPDVRKFPGEKSFKNIDLVEEGGSFYLVAEQSLRYQMDGRAIRYSHGELVVSKFAGDEIKWTKVLPRNTDVQDLNCNIVATPDKISLVYPESPASEKYNAENYPQGKLKPAYNCRDSYVVSYTIDSGGAVAKSLIKKNKDACIFPQKPNTLLDKNSLLLYLDESRIGKFGMLTF